MPSLQVHVLNSVNEAVQVRDKWNDLWSRSATTRPTSRAEFLRVWIDQFAPNEKFRAIIVEEGSDFVAALPLIGKRWGSVLPIGSLPRNEWLTSGNLLLDESRVCTPAIALLADNLCKMPWSVYRFPLIPSHEKSWHLIREPFSAAGFISECRPSFEVSLIEVTTDWETYERSLSKSHRKKLARTIRQMTDLGGYHIRRYRPRAPTSVAPLLETAFKIEDSGWKGEAGTSVLRSQGMRECLVQVSEHLARCGELEVAFLEFNDEIIAFELLWNAKQVLHSYKVGYNEKYSSLMPGTILMHEVLKDLFDTQRCRAYDCLGPRTLATSKWSTAYYQKSQWTITHRHPLGRAFMLGYQWLGRRSDRVGSHPRLEPSLTIADSHSTSTQLLCASAEQ